ncbi:hypothetical protein Pmani_034814 [Petrolisthes manimaculis]|uniref:Uncharacterized protein n=1 Tax=Petrolisthes manimaculis TaxID=1843537 RepID=A0AAE1NNK7_9EUCA|nr:hypothetical protein Pmani_034814 [Petrolisthes manimaculis]
MMSKAEKARVTKRHPVTTKNKRKTLKGVAVAACRAREECQARSPPSLLHKMNSKQGRIGVLYVLASSLTLSLPSQPRRPVPLPHHGLDS